MRVLIVEDEIRIREGIGRLLVKLADDVEIIGTATNGEEGLAMAEAFFPDVVITDIRMPKMDGLEMIAALREEGTDFEAIVLSAYSEFEYARTAVKLGVTEYLLKPIAINDLSQALTHVREKLAAKKSRKPDSIGTLEQVFRDIIEGHMEPSEEITGYLDMQYHIDASKPMVVLCIYLGSGFAEMSARVASDFGHILSLYKGTEYCMIGIEHRRSLLAVMYGYEDAHDLERWVQYQLLSRKEAKVSVGWIEAGSVGELRDCFDRLFPYMDWNIAFDKDIMISYPKITYVRTDSCVYPIELESDMKAAVCSYDTENIRAVMQRFHQGFRNGRIYLPKEVKECCVRFMWAMIGTAKEIGCMGEELDQQQLLTMVMNAKTKEELEEASEFLIGRISGNPRNDELNVHLTVKKAVAMVKEFYQTGITLDEISARLSITPEYLGTLFHKEMKVPFSTYIRNFRMDKAKELLKGTQLKLYEIAAKVGYSDPKYFGKVFKEVTGKLPTEYRKGLS